MDAILRSVDNSEWLLWFLNWGMISTGVVTFIACMIQKAPYGRYSTEKGWGVLLPARFAWFVMESPNLWISAIFYLYYARETCTTNLANNALMSMFIMHYIHRAVLYPLRMPRSSAPMPIAVTALAFIFCCYNGLMQALSLSIVQPKPKEWVHDLRFIAGVILFFVGMGINISAGK